jgi:hypothetical protein
VNYETNAPAITLLLMNSRITNFNLNGMKMEKDAIKALSESNKPKRGRPKNAKDKVSICLTPFRKSERPQESQIVGVVSSYLKTKKLA